MSTAARIDELRTKFEENPRRYFAPLANEYRKAGELAQAIALCREHLPRQPGHMSGHIVFGQALFESGELIEAQSVFESALQLDPENLIALRHLGDIARERGDAALARRWYERVLDADPRNDDIASLLASLAQRLTPRSTTPQASVAFDASGAPSYAEHVVESDAPESDPFEAPDAPAWHTPPFLTPLDSRAVSDDRVTGESAVIDHSADLLDLELPGDPIVRPHEESPVDLADAESPIVSRIESAVVAYSDLELADIAEATASEESADFTEFSESAESPETAESPESAEFSEPATAEHSSINPIAVAIEAFQSNDPFDLEVSVPLSITPSASVVDDSDSDWIERDETDMSTVHDPDAIAASDDFEEGLIAIEWPDTSLINSRAATPAQDIVAVSDETADAAFGEEAPEDEDPPLSSAELTWLAVEESESEAAFDEETFEEPSQVFESASAEQDATQSAEAEDAAEEPAFVTETMAELLVAQGFLGRAIDVYEELVRRRPYDAVLTTRLAELREAAVADLVDDVTEAEVQSGIAAELVDDVTEAEVQSGIVAELVDDVTEAEEQSGTVAELVDEAVDEYVQDELVAISENAIDQDSWDSAAPTPLYGVTPVDSPRFTPAAVPLVAPAPQQTARAFFAALASVRVARRTPAFGSQSVATLTPADGLASLFGEVPVASDDVAARSLAQAFGSSENVEPGPSLFDPESESDAPIESEPQVSSQSALSSASPATASPAVPAAPAFSFDRFFPDPATTGQSASAARRSQATPAATPVVGSGSGDESAAPESSSAGQDLAQFAHWLKGLSNS